jgi:hypothetical protein
MLTHDTLDDALHTLGELLAHRAAPTGLVLVGGGALVLLGLLERSTRDLDVVARIDTGALAEAEPLPPALQAAVTEVAVALDLAPDWLNTGPAALLRLGLPEGFAQRAHRRRYGALEIWLADRYDQIHLKLYAAADHWPARSRHLVDLRALRPTAAELRAAADWCRSHDPSVAFDDEQLQPVLLHLRAGTTGNADG